MLRQKRATCSNRTFMELKYVGGCVLDNCMGSSNRTFMELKFNIISITLFGSMF